MANALLKNRDRRLQELKAFVDRYGAHVRRMRGDEWTVIHGRGWGDSSFIPDFPALRAVATAADVAAGRAVFALPGNRKLAALHLPASARLKKDHDKKWAKRVIIVQAEIDEAGTIHYGIVGSHEIRAAGSDELEDIQPMTLEEKAN